MDNGKTLRDYEARAQKVRAHLKQWEADWAKGHDGKKPGREDIKNNPSIAQKYKDYNKLRDIISGKVVPAPSGSAKREPGSTKRKPDGPPPAETPHKKTKQFETPSKAQAYADSNGYMNSPAVSRKLFSPATITSLGPTPQRDGKVLGLFDLLVEKELGASPRQVSGGSRGKARSHPSSVQATPSRRRDSLKDDDLVKLGHTPGSSKKRIAGLFATPIKKKDGPEAGTPSSVSKLTFDTPAFLRRQKLPTLDEQSSFDAPAPLRLPRKPFSRGLSEIITSLRKVEEELEEEHADDDLRALEEAQNGEMELGKPALQRPKSAPGPVSEKPSDVLDSDVLKPDDQKPQLLGGFDDEGMYDSPVEESGKPMRIFKKKGQKRTTRKVNIRPTRHKRPTDSAANGDLSEVEEGKSDDEVVDDGVNDDDDDDDYDEQKDTSTQKGGKTSDKEHVVKKAVRKVNELAHANFQRLKLRNHGAKGGPGHNSRFRRRR